MNKKLINIGNCHAELGSASIMETALWIPNQVRNDILIDYVKRRITKILILFLLLIIPVINLFAQESNTKPLELPNFIIEGKEQLNVRSGIKQFPDKPGLLSKNELDSINSLEKRQSLLLPPEPLPDRIMHTVYKKGYFTADFGRFTTASAEGGYEFRAGEYDLFGNAGFDYSSGHIDNAGYDKAFINLNADYIANEKYWIFGGSKTRTNLFFKNMDYKLYSIPKNPEKRNTINLDLKIETDGNYEGFAFNTGGGVRVFQVKQDSSKSFDNAINGFISVKNLTSDYEIGGDLLVDLHSVRGNGTHFMQGDIFGTYIHENFSLKAKAGIQSVNTSTEIARLGLLAAGDMEIRMSEMFTIRANVLIGMGNNSLYEIISGNPYAAHNVIIDYAYYLPSLRGSFVIHPNEVFSAEIGAEFAMVQRSPIYFDTSGGEFAINYTDITKLEAFAEMNYNISSMDEVSINLVFDKSEIEGGNTVPYSIPMKFAMDYKRKWLKNFGTQFGIFYIDERFSDLQNQNKLNSYIDLRFKAEYSVSDLLNIFVRLENMMNNDIRIWNGYKERGLFITGGVLLKF